MQALYFAYGSNLLSERMQGRVPSARRIRTACLAGYSIATDKAGRDGTAKANLRRDGAAIVWGVVWAIDPAERPLLDACEGGYERVHVTLDEDSAFTYVSERRTDDPVLAAGYKRFLVEGAREHGLPPEWIALLEALPAR